MPIGYYKTTSQDQTLKALDYTSFLGLLYDIQPLVGQVSGSGIYNGESNNVEADFLSYHNEIKATYNSLFPDSQITMDATIPLFKNSTPFEPFFTLLKDPNLGNALALYNEIYRPKTLSEQIQFMSQLYDTARDPLAVGMNQIFDQLTSEAESEFNSRYASQAGYSLLDGFSMIMESGNKTAAIGQLNRDLTRTYSAISVSGNISDKISNPYTKLFVNFTSNNENPVKGVTASYSASDIFRYPTTGQQVYNIQFDDNLLNLEKGFNDYNHVSYARNENHPYHEFFIKAAALSQYAVYDDGQALKSLLMQAKGFTTDIELNGYLSNNNGIITIGKADVDRTQ
jgi:hypothetical protein